MIGPCTQPGIVLGVIDATRDDEGRSLPQVQEPGRVHGTTFMRMHQRSPPGSDRAADLVGKDFHDCETIDVAAAPRQRRTRAGDQPLRPAARRELSHQEFGLAFATTVATCHVDMTNEVLAEGGRV
jgi:hypothetical protein